jgi:cytochrome b
VIGFLIDWQDRGFHHRNGMPGLAMLVLALLMFRLVWGLVGGLLVALSHRSSTRLAASWQLLAKARPHPDHLIGHNPLGAGSVFAMLAWFCWRRLAPAAW